MFDGANPKELYKRLMFDQIWAHCPSPKAYFLGQSIMASWNPIQVTVILKLIYQVFKPQAFNN